MKFNPESHKRYIMSSTYPGDRRRIIYHLILSPAEGNIFSLSFSDGSGHRQYIGEIIEDKEEKLVFKTKKGGIYTFSSLRI